MTRLSGRWIGIGIAVLLVGGFALYAAGAGSHPAPATGALPPAAPPDAGAGVQSVQVVSPGTMIGLLLKVGVVAALLGGSLWLLRRYAGTQTRAAGRTGAVSIADTVPLAQGRVLYLVDVGDRALVIGATPQQLSLVGEVTDAATLEKLRAPAPAPASPLANISHRFESAVQGISKMQASAAAPRRMRAGGDTAPPSFARALAGIERGQSPVTAGALDAADEEAWLLEEARRPGRATPSEDGALAHLDNTARLRALAERLRAARGSA